MTLDQESVSRIDFSHDKQMTLHTVDVLEVTSTPDSSESQEELNSGSCPTVTDRTEEVVAQVNALDNCEVRDKLRQILLKYQNFFSLDS